MNKIKIYSFRNFFERFLFEVILQQIWQLIIVFGLIYIFKIRENGYLSLLGIAIYIIVLFISIAFRFFNNAVLFVKAEGLIIKRFYGITETIKWEEIAEANFSRELYKKKFTLRIELRLKLITNKTITISLEKFIGQASPLIVYKKIKECLPRTFKFKDIEETELQSKKINEIEIIKKSENIFLKTKKLLCIAVIINSLLFIYSIVRADPSKPAFPKMLIGLFTCSFGYILVGMLLGLIIAIFPYKRMNYEEKFRLSFGIGIWIVQIVFILFWGYIAYYYFKRH